ncbi:cell wall elongation regulator TseB-like domain-containing protein [Heyndrickxia sp. FSL W8-0423]|uniref:cell wall elongation regulator TseB-like domain-containing protein n=1 Tax=Heyndrickxia sp. FSL W8-0423 TaxID=2921601 RepID=UPI0030F66749
MKKWIIGLCLLLLIVLGFSVNVYYQSTKPINKAESLAKKKAKEKANLVSMDKFYLYNGKESYYIAVGKQKNGENIAVWIPEKNGERVTIEKMSDGLSKQDAINKLKEKETPKKILGSRLGMLNNEPVWEISYLDQSSRLNYAYIYFLKSSNKTPYMIYNI